MFLKMLKSHQNPNTSRFRTPGFWLIVRTNMKKPGFVLLVLLGFSVLFPWVNKFTQWIDNTNIENRTLAARPGWKDLTLDNYDSFPDKVDRWMSDKFGLRSEFMRLYGKMNLNVFQKSPLPRDVYFGKDGWMFFTGNELATYNGYARFTELELDSFYRELNDRRAFCKSKGMEYYFVIFPAKQSIYGDLQPDAVIGLQRKNRTDILIEYLRKRDPSLHIVDTRSELIKARKNWYPIQVFYKTDNHWNPLGAWHGHAALVNQMHRDGIKVKLPGNPKSSRYRLDKQDGYSGNLAQFTGLSGALTEPKYWLVPLFERKAIQVPNYKCETPQFSNAWEYQMRFNNKDTTLADILFIRDSFGSDMINELAESCGRSLFIFDEWKYGMNTDWAERHKPDVMVNLVVETHLENVLKKVR